VKPINVPLVSQQDLSKDGKKKKSSDAMVLYDYEAQEPGEISLKEADIVQVLKKNGLIFIGLNFSF
jgi:hypothetical protein